MRPPVLGLLVATALAGSALAGCASAARSPEGTGTSAPPTNPMLQDSFFRPVRMTSGRALTYVQPETAGQILCHIVSEDRWSDLLDGRVGLHPTGSPDAACLVASEWGGVSLTLRKSYEAFAAQTTVGGRPAAVHNDPSGHVIFTVAVTDDALQPVRHNQALDVLELQLTYGGAMDAGEQRRRGQRVLDEVVPLLVREGERLPDIGAGGRINYVSTTLMAGDQFVDLPMPVQALQLCTIVQEQPTIGIAAKQAEVNDQGRCRLVTAGGESITVSMEHTSDRLGDYPDRIAGRPAKLRKDPPTARVRLVDAAQVDLVVDAPDATALAGNLVPALRGQ